MKMISRIAKDMPISVTLLVMVLVAAHLFLSIRYKVLDLSAAVAKAPELVEVYAGFAGVSALAGGFVGVLIVFSTLTGGSWSRVRNLGGKGLLRNWVSPMRVTFMAAFLSIAASLLTQVGLARAAWWIFELAVLLTLSAVFRIFWLLSGLLVVQQNVDREEALKARQLSLADLGLKDLKGPPSP